MQGGATDCEARVYRHTQASRKEATTQQERKKTSKKSGDYSEEATPVPISNTAVKLFSAHDTWREAARESRSLPVCKKENHESGSLFYLSYSTFAHLIRAC